MWEGRCSFWDKDPGSSCPSSKTGSSPGSNFDRWGAKATVRGSRLQSALLEISEEVPVQIPPWTSFED